MATHDQKLGSLSQESEAIPTEQGVGLVSDVYCMAINCYISPICWVKQMAILGDVIVDIRIGQNAGYCRQRYMGAKH